MPWQITTLLLIATGSLGSLQKRRVGLYKRDLSAYTLAVGMTCVFAVSVVVALFRNDFADFEVVKSNLGLLVLAGALIAFRHFLVIKLFRYLPASLAVILVLLEAVAVVVLASYVLEEGLSSTQWLGAFLLSTTILLAGIVAHNSHSKASKRAIVVGFGIAILLALITGPAAIMEKYLLDRLGVPTYMLYGYGMQALFSYVIAIYFWNKNSHKNIIITKNMRVDIWSYGLLLGLSGLLFSVSLKNSDSISVLTIATTSVVAGTMLLSYIFLKEREYVPFKIFSLFLTAIGLALLFSV